MDADHLLQLYLAVWLAVLGAAMGSFTACAADRFADGQPLVRGRSRCDSCGHVLAARDLIPVLSFLLCGGRCRYCGARIPSRCLFAELTGAVLFAALGLRYGLQPTLAMQMIAGGVLLLLSLIDWRTHMLPDKLLLVLAANRLLFVFLLRQPLGETLARMAVGALSVSLPLLALSLVMDHLLQKDTLGGGDIKLLFVLGLYLSWLEMVLLLVVACVLALFWVAAAGKKALSRPEIPLGPFLAAAWLVVTLFGAQWTAWYLSLLY